LYILLIKQTSTFEQSQTTIYKLFKKKLFKKQQGRAKADPRQSQGRAKADPRQSQGRAKAEPRQTQTKLFINYLLKKNKKKRQSTIEKSTI
jgi:hypothetical protein